MTELKECKYRLPCGWCDKKNEKCEFSQRTTINKSFDFDDKENYFKNLLSPHCDHEWHIKEKTISGRDETRKYICENCAAERTICYYTSLS